MSEEQTYQVLARKYRPETFADLVGQDAMVRTLKNAFAADRIAQAFVMTGIRGTGKTTTARIIAKGLNCTGPDGQGGPTTEPCGVCEHCVAISEGRHVDVMEMDAASRTGVNDIREIIESVHYRAASARYKIYIIDEVHMLSTSAFNALLKTLEEPPPHVKFIFATTEIRKVPVTVLSRCQRFDLRRIEPEVMIALLRRIASAEGAQITDDALALITRAAEGSARDATSLLDQAISHGAGETTAAQVRAMLGLADRGRVLDLFDMILRGAAAEALAELQAQYADGADPMAVLRDLAEITHWVSIVKITPEALDDPTIGPDERARGQQIAEKVPMRALTRLWQMLLKALDEVGQAPNAMMAAEMAIIRLTHVADLPDPEALIRKVQASAAAGAFSRSAAPPIQRSEARQDAPQAAAPRAPVAARPDGSAAALAVSPNALAGFPDFESVIDLIRRMRDMKLLLDVEDHLRLVRYSPGRIEFQPTEHAPRDLAQRLAERLRGWTGGQRWAVTVTSDPGRPTISERRAEREAEARARAMQNPTVQAIFAAFPGAKITRIRPIPVPVAVEKPAGEDTSPHELTEGPVAEVEEWDPFEDED
ncbi:DNA polymerase III subunit gamma/tau [Paracoccus sp. P2]|uniref:DNA polymerase III subunit gamma/tau n=1 Tax=Paracoccus pantotrophus TaxID=82367 RepID=A0A7H9BVC0_PARPN|nr:DNA polymerase III subunit gamma/tau [Paracoccus pantotrophus]MDF3856556.1 DNA polymerase III subunit gamma/tau [Paracoccus pantotrophus]QLH15142.1 DNA polymerase III subunit gamma/tau [Paracoccus pantotrophus]RDD96884.1 DNA polymerase III subunit gamma/tau [Paracoccus pantotrophus]RNI16323.1 DNA polymerase III subunit gamma/tau [Paracoccus pantotrophus]WGR65226.1 DNA polymerase III subunit gamma/tau [Paracoccus pantotrophus]